MGKDIPNPGEYERSLERTPTWAVAVVCFVLVVISLFIEHIIHIIGKLMILGFISLLLIVFQAPITDICVPKSVGATWHPCKKGYKDSKEETDSQDKGRKLLQLWDSGFGSRRILAAKEIDKCTLEDKVALVSKLGIHQLHIFIFVLAVVHVLYCITTLALGRTKMRIWKVWEEETKKLEYQYNHDPQRFRFARDTSFGRRHLNFWSKSTISLWIVCFFRQFFTSVNKVDYLALRHGFIMVSFNIWSNTMFELLYMYTKSRKGYKFVLITGAPMLPMHIWHQKMKKTVESYGSLRCYSSCPTHMIILLVGTKLLVIITQMGLRIHETADVVRGEPVVKPGDDLFWFGRPKFILFLIHLVLFQNAFQLAFFAWSMAQFGLSNCFHNRTVDIVIRISMGVIIQVVCSYVTLPLYALVTQMGSSMSSTIFNDQLATGLKDWHNIAKKNAKHSNHTETKSPISSTPTTPTHGTSPVHLLHNYHHSSHDSLHASPRRPNVRNDHWDNNESHLSGHSEQEKPEIQEPSSFQLPSAPPDHTQHEINISSSFAFRK
ncbi:mlo-like protein 6 [Quercus suber]|uniref:MLO-like protein n=1 Tax=Quercus suber TaxID=58331 RepID=A0AAW0IU08_QUESU